MANRNRGTIALSEEAKTKVLSALYQRGWSRELWASKAYTSLSTVKRLLRGNRIESGCFHTLLQVLGLEVEDSYIQKRSNNPQSSLLPSSPEPPLLQHQPGVVMTATFTEATRPQIERTMRHLQSLLINKKVMFSEDGGVVSIRGEFSENDRKQIEMTIAQLEDLFTSSTVTW